jgi:hypothetical protein
MIAFRMRLREDAYDLRTCSRTQAVAVDRAHCACAIQSYEGPWSPGRTFDAGQVGTGERRGSSTPTREYAADVVAAVNGFVRALRRNGAGLRAGFPTPPSSSGLEELIAFAQSGRRRGASIALRRRGVRRTTAMILRGQDPDRS